MGKFRIYNGSAWVDPCECPVYIQDAAGVWQLIDPNNCDVNYFDGNNWCPITCGTGNEVGINTEINIWFDNSGSMNATLPALNAMKDGALKSCLLPIYNNDTLLYDERVQVFNMLQNNLNERFLACFVAERNLNRVADPNVDFVINLVFQDEGNPGYHTGNWDTTIIEPQYSSDINNLRNTLGLVPYAIKGSLIQVQGNADFAELTEATFIDVNAYLPPFNISDLYQSKFTFKPQVEKGQTINIPYKYYASAEIDWPVGTYVVPLNTITGVGSGMIVEVTVEQIVGKIDAINFLNLGAGLNGAYTPAPYTGGVNRTTQNGTGSGAVIQVTDIDALGSITGANTTLPTYDGSRNYTIGDIVQVKDQSSPQPVTFLEFEVLSVFDYNAISSLTIVDYGNGLYANSDTVELPGQGGGSNINKSISNGGTPAVYLQKIVDSLNDLGVTTPPCI